MQGEILPSFIVLIFGQLLEHGIEKPLHDSKLRFLEAIFTPVSKGFTQMRHETKTLILNLTLHRNYLRDNCPANPN